MVTPLQQPLKANRKAKGKDKVKEIEFFWSLVEHATRALNQGVSTSDFEPDFVKVVEFVKGHEDLRSEFTREIRRMIEGEAPVPEELLTFCIHALRWPELKKIAENAYETRQDLPAKMFLTDVLDAFSDNWKSTELYKYFG